MKRTVRSPVAGIPVVAILMLVPATVVFASPGQPASPLVQVSGGTDLSSCSADGVSAQIGTNYAGSEVEPQLAVNPVISDRNGDQLLDSSDVGLAATFQQDRWSNSGSRAVVTGISANGGSLWTEVIIPGITKCTGGTWDRASNAWITFAPSGELYHSALVLNKEKTMTDILISKSLDEGETWGAPVGVIADTATRNDKPSITADPYRSGHVYLVWQRQSTMSTFFSRTTDGTSWEAPRRISSLQLMGAEIVVLPDESLVNVGGALKGKGSSVTSQRSVDAGAAWTAGTSFASITKAEVVDPETGHKVRTAGSFGMPDVAVDSDPSSPGYGNVYAVWEDGRFSGRARPKFSGIALSMSSDGGATWSAPIKVNQTPSSLSSGNQQTFDPSVAVSDGGVVGVAYYDLRNNTSSTATLPTDRWLAHCHPAVRTSCTSCRRLEGRGRAAYRPELRHQRSTRRERLVPRRLRRSRVLGRGVSQPVLCLHR